MGLKDTSLYIHVPFCLKKCNYCAFYSVTNLNLCDDYIKAVCRAVDNRDFKGRIINTIYFGGGTPSLLGTGLVKILNHIKERCVVSENAEITLEANPGTVDLATLTALYNGGFNRISMGLQAGDDENLKILGRCHSVYEGKNAVTLSKMAGFRNISVDIMLGTPNQTVEKAVSLAEYAASLDVPHISSYMLKVEEGTPFYKNHIENSCPDVDTTADIYLAVCKKLEDLGYCHYEVSNFAKKGYESRHNLAYWKLTDYLGIGPAAYSFMDGERFSIAPDVKAFIETENIWEKVSRDGKGGDFEEYLMLSLRIDEGFSFKKAAEVYGIDPEKLKKRAVPLVKNGLVEISGDKMTLTDRGFLVSNSVITFLED